MHFALLLCCARIAASLDIEAFAATARGLSDAELDDTLSVLQGEKLSLQQRDDAPKAVSTFLFAHKKTYAMAEPIEAAMFLQKYFGGAADKNPFQHHCDDSSLEQPQTKNVNFPPTKAQPNGFAIHFVRNPHKTPTTGGRVHERERAWRKGGALARELQRGQSV